MIAQFRQFRNRDTGDLPDRLDRVSLIMKEESGQLDRRTLVVTERLLRRAGQRLRLSGDHTVVALAGGTGSGKSSLFNALAGLSLSQVGIRRPTTASPYACVWGGEQNVSALLDWLGVPADRRIGRESELDADTETALRGLVLLDLPDHDSVEMEHRLEVDRLVDLVDVLVWVVDPQKYADAAIHERYLRPLRSYSDVMMVVLNQADRLDPGQAQSCLQDLRRMLSDDGLAGIRTMLTSARSGVGVDDLRTVLTTAVASRQATARRISADLDGLSLRLGHLVLPEVDLTLLAVLAAPANTALVELAGIDRLAASCAAEYQTRGRRRTGWPLSSWRHRREESSPPLALLRSDVDALARSVARQVDDGLPPGWQRRVEQAAVTAADPMAEELDGVVRAQAQAQIPAPGWWRTAAVAHWLLLFTAAAGATLAVTMYVRSSHFSGWVQLGAGLAVGALLIGCASGEALARLVLSAARSWQSRIDAQLREQGTAVTDAMLSTLHGELETYNLLQQTLRSFAPAAPAAPVGADELPKTP